MYPTSVPFSGSGSFLKSADLQERQPRRSKYCTNIGDQAGTIHALYNPRIYWYSDIIYDRVAARRDLFQMLALKLFVSRSIL